MACPRPRSCKGPLAEQPEWTFSTACHMAAARAAGSNCGTWDVLRSVHSRRTQPTTLRQEGASVARGPSSLTPGSKVTQEGAAALGQEPLLPTQTHWLVPSTG